MSEACSISKKWVETPALILARESRRLGRMSDDAVEEFGLLGVRAFVISLGPVPRNPLLIDQLNNCGLKPHILKAIDGRSWTYPFHSDTVDIKTFEGILGRVPTGPEVGCALSHLRCAREASAADASYSVVFEEDAFIFGDIRPAVEFIREIDSEKPTVVQLFSSSLPFFDPGSVTEVAPGSAMVAGRFLLPPANTVAYILNRSAIAAFASRPIVEGVADWPPYANSFQFWGLQPWPVSHSVEGSTIEHQRKVLISDGEVRNRFLRFLTNYFLLFQVNRVKHHSQSVGGLRAYFLRVVIPETRMIWFRLRGVPPSVKIYTD